MKKSKFLYYAIIALTVLSVFILVVALQILPNNIPVQYSSENRITGWGSKYLLILFIGLELMVIGIFCGSGFLLEKLSSSEKERNDCQKNRRALNIIGLCVLIMLNTYFYTSLINAYSVAVLEGYPLINITSVACCAVGIIFIAMGVIVRNTKRNLFLGVRTKLSLKDDLNWYKAQKTSFFVLVSGGCIMIIGSFFVPDRYKLLWLIIGSLFIAIMNLILSSITLKKGKRQNEDVL